MKIISAILATLILFLTMQPMLITANYMADNNVVDKCCLDKNNASKNKTGKESNKNCCNDGQCDNPFLSCANCYFLNTDNAFLITKINVQVKKIRLMNDKVSSSYIQDFWHPPEVV